MAYALIDIGNTSIKVKIYEGKEAISSFQVLRNKSALTFFFNAINVNTILISSVVPTLNKLIRSVTKKPVVFLNHKHFDDLNIFVEPKESVGIDRLVNAIAIKHNYCCDAIIVDIGTCVTLCHINSTGDYFGGMIMPGFEMVQNALHIGAEQLPLVSFPNTKPNLIGQSTEAAMAAGIFYGAVHMINGVINEWRKQLSTATVILTGGAPHVLLDQIDHDLFKPELQFEGLETLYSKLF